MNIPEEFAERFAAFPLKLRNLVLAEIAAGNSIVEISGGFPAPPVGAWLKLAKHASTRPRQSARGVDFYEHNSASYSGEFTDAKRFFFVLEPALPPPPEPDMNTLRAEMKAKQHAAEAELFREQARRGGRAKKTGRTRKSSHATVSSPLPPQPLSPMDAIRADLVARERASDEKFYSELYDKGGGSVRPQPSATPPPKTTVERFRDSMTIDYDQWREGIGYDLELLKTATPEELVELEDLLIRRCPDDWREVEALAALNSPRARVALRNALKSSNHQVRLAVHRYAPALVSDTERTAALVAAIQGADTYSGLTPALMQIETFHPPAIIQALLRGLMERDGGSACHFAAMLYFLHGKSASAFDWKHRPFFLRFNTLDLKAREKVVRELCETIGADPSRCIKPKPKRVRRQKS